MNDRFFDNFLTELCGTAKNPLFIYLMYIGTYNSINHSLCKNCIGKKFYFWLFCQFTKYDIWCMLISTETQKTQSKLSVTLERFIPWHYLIIGSIFTEENKTNI